MAGWPYLVCLGHVVEVVSGGVSVREGSVVGEDLDNDRGL